MLLKRRKTETENTTIDPEQLLTWISGLLAGCPDCTEDARSWAEKVDLTHNAPEPEPESKVASSE
jgi:hypothetical protein